MSKGSKQRPGDKARFDRNHDAIRWKSKQKRTIVQCNKKLLSKNDTV